MNDLRFLEKKIYDGSITSPEDFYILDHEIENLRKLTEKILKDKKEFEKDLYKSRMLIDHIREASNNNSVKSFSELVQEANEMSEKSWITHKIHED